MSVEERLNLFWTDDGWLVDLREYRHYPVYGEGSWTLRQDTAGIGFAAVGSNSEGEDG